MALDNIKDFFEEEKLKELEIQSILEETHYLTDKEEMEKTAQKYRAKPKMTEIFSNADKKPRLTNNNPLDIDETIEAEEVTESTILGEKTSATMQASLLMDSMDEEVTQQHILEDNSPAEESENNTDSETESNEENSTTDTEQVEDEQNNEDEIVTLSPEYGEDTQFSSEVLGEVEQFDDDSKIESINTIDIEITDESLEKNTTVEDKVKQEEILTETNQKESKPPKKVIAKVPVYKLEDNEDVINIKAGKFSEVVGAEYEEYIRSKNPSVIAHVIKNEPKPFDDEDEDIKPKDNRPIQERIIQAVVGFFSKDESDDNDTPQEHSKPVEDYTGDDDEKSIMFELNLNIKKLFMRSLLTGGIALFSIILTIITRFFPEAICSTISFAPVAYAVLYFLLLGVTVFANRVAILSGLTPLIKFKGNSDTAVAIGTVAAVLQTLVSFFCLGNTDSFNINYYCVIIMLAFFANNVGKLLMVLRVKDNFKFVSSKGQKYAAKIYNNETVAGQMMSGTAVDRPIIAYQHKTDFPSNFLKISYAPDPSEDLASKLAPVTTITAVLIAIIYGFAKVSFADAINTFALMTAIAVPVSTLLAVNLPVRMLCKKLLSFGAMLAGYPSIKQFCDSTAVMIDANELFPADSIELEGIKTFEEYNVDESLLYGISILKEAKNPIAKAFDSVVAETAHTLPDVESVLYEDELGLVGWIKSERILVGSRMLMEKYCVELPDIKYEEKFTSGGKQVTYLSRAGRLVAMFVTSYKADPELKVEIQRAETNGISFLIRTTDFNITNDLVASLYNVFYRSVKVLPTGLGNVLKEAQSTQEETSRSYLITNGKAPSLARAVSGSVTIKHNISLAILIQLIAIIIGILLAATLSLYAGVGVMGTLEVLIYALFWSTAAIIAPAVQKP